MCPPPSAAAQSHSPPKTATHAESQSPFRFRSQPCNSPHPSPPAPVMSDYSPYKDHNSPPRNSTPRRSRKPENKSYSWSSPTPRFHSPNSAAAAQIPPQSPRLPVQKTNCRYFLHNSSTQ